MSIFSKQLMIILVGLCLLAPLSQSFAMMDDSTQAIEPTEPLGNFHVLPRGPFLHMASFLDSAALKALRQSSKSLRDLLPTVKDIKAEFFLNDGIILDSNSFLNFLVKIREHVPNLDETLGMSVRKFIEGRLNTPEKWKVFQRFTNYFPEKAALLRVTQAAARELSMEQYLRFCQHFSQATFLCDSLSIDAEGDRISDEFYNGFSTLPNRFLALKLNFQQITEHEARAIAAGLRNCDIQRFVLITPRISNQALSTIAQSLPDRILKVELNQVNLSNPLTLSTFLEPLNAKPIFSILRLKHNQLNGIAK